MTAEPLERERKAEEKRKAKEREREQAETERKAKEHRERLLRFRDLRQLGIVTNHPTLKRWQEVYGFPLGRMLGANTRVWTQAEVYEWLANRPTEGRRGIDRRTGAAARSQEEAA